MVDEDTLQFQLNLMFPGGTIVTDSTKNGRVNSAIVAAHDVEVLGLGRKGDGSLLWITITTPIGPANICSL